MKTFTTTALITLVAAVMSAGIDPAAARCFQTGAKYDNKDTARYHVARACEGYDGKRGAFQGRYAPGEVKSACVDIRGGKQIKMSVKNLNNGAARDLGDNDCTFRLSKEIDNCDRGSEKDWADWRFR